MRADVHSVSEDSAHAYRYAGGVRHRGGGSGVHGATGMEGAPPSAEDGLRGRLRLRSLTANCGTANCGTANCETANRGSLNASSHYNRSLETRKPQPQVLQLGLLTSRLPCIQASGATAIAVGSFAVRPALCGWRRCWCPSHKRHSERRHSKRRYGKRRYGKPRNGKPRNGKRRQPQPQQPLLQKPQHGSLNRRSCSWGF